MQTRTTPRKFLMIITTSKTILTRITKILMTCAQHQLMQKERGLKTIFCLQFKVSGKLKHWTIMKFMSRTLIVKWAWKTSLENLIETMVCTQLLDLLLGSGNSCKMISYLYSFFIREIRSCRISQWSWWSWWLNSLKMEMGLKAVSSRLTGHIQRVLIATRWLKCWEATKKLSYNLKSLQYSWSISLTASEPKRKTKSMRIWSN